MTRSRALTILLFVPALLLADTDPTLKPLLKAVEAHYNHAQSLKLNFSETYAGVKRPVQADSGTLYLRKPGRMRWDYATPAGKIFLSDGRDVFLYTPGDPQAERSRLKESEDVRAPLAFLLGKLDFAKEFRTLKTAGAASPKGETWFVAEPKSANLAWTQAEFLVSPDGHIHQVRVTLQDQSKLDFTFSNEQENVPLANSMFRFQPPPGVQIVEASQP